MFKFLLGRHNGLWYSLRNLYNAGSIRDQPTLYIGPRKEVKMWAKHQGPADHLGKEKEASSVSEMGLVWEDHA